MLRRAILLVLTVGALGLSVPTRTKKVDPLPAPDGNLHVFALPIAQGDANVIQCPNGDLTLYDFGTSNDDVDRFWVGPELQTFLGSSSNLIRNIIVTHQHWDHYRLLPDTFPDISTLAALENIYISCTQADMASTMVDWIDAIGGSGLVREFNAGGQCGPVGPACGNIDICPGTPITGLVMAANLGQHCTDGGNKNMDSIVLKITHGAVTMILPGDFEDETTDWDEDGPQKWMSDYYGAEMDVTITHISHHGADYLANKPVWRDALRPQMVFASGDAWYDYQHPRCEIFDSYLQYVGTICKPLADPSDPLYCGGDLVPNPLPSQILQDTYTCGFSNDTFVTRTNNEFAIYTTVPDSARMNLLDVSTDGTLWSCVYTDQTLPLH